MASQVRVLSEPCGEDHPCAGQKGFQGVSLNQVRINKLLSGGYWVEFLVFDKLCLMLGNEVKNDIMRLDPISLPKF
jgi:hypothetical protein